MLRYLYLDLNSFFASCEQQERPHLRGRPVAVVPVMADSTCAIAASYAAKAFGVRTGTRVSEAKKLCPNLVLVQARPKLYVQYHQRILQAIDRVIPVLRVHSIDEVICRLDRTEADPVVAQETGRRAKQIILSEVGECMTSSVGIAPNPFLAKLASNLQKPDGLTVLRQEDLPHALHRLKLAALPGIGPRMEKRLMRCGIYDVKTLCEASTLQMRAIWGGVGGLKFHAQLGGEDFTPAETETRSMSHQHVLDPSLRTRAGGFAALQPLLVKGAERMRMKNFYCRRLSVQVKLAGDRGYWENESSFTETQDTGFLLSELERLWKTYPNLAPLRVGVIFSGLVSAERHQLDLFSNPRNPAALTAIDEINRRFGRGTINFGLNPHREKIGKDKIAFQRVPEIYEV